MILLSAHFIMEAASVRGWPGYVRFDPDAGYRVWGWRPAEAWLEDVPFTALPFPG